MLKKFILFLFFIINYANANDNRSFDRFCKLSLTEVKIINTRQKLSKTYRSNSHMNTESKEFFKRAMTITTEMLEIARQIRKDEQDPVHYIKFLFPETK